MNITIKGTFELTLSGPKFSEYTREISDEVLNLIQAAFIKHFRPEGGHDPLEHFSIATDWNPKRHEN